MSDIDVVHAEKMQVKFARKHIWPSGELGKVTITMDFGEEIEITEEQAKSLSIVIALRLGLVTDKEKV